MNNEFDDQAVIVELEGETGKVNVELDFYFTDGKREFVVATNVENAKDSYILEYVPVQDGHELVAINDKDEFKRLSDIAIQLMEEEAEALEEEEEIEELY